MTAAARVTTRIGRFAFDLPSTLHVAARNQRVYGADVAVIAMPSRGLEWFCREAHANHAIVRSFELQPGVPAIWYRDAPSLDRVSLEVVKPVGDHLFVVRCSGETDPSPIAENLATVLVDGYVSGTHDGFCLEAGSLTSVPGLSEQTAVSFAHESVPAWTITFRTEAIGGGAYAAFFDDDPAAERIPYQTRDGLTAGLDWRENRSDWSAWDDDRIPAQWRSVVRFVGTFWGVAYRCDQPKIHIVATGPESHRTQFEQVWDELVATLRQVPLSPDPAPLPLRIAGQPIPPHEALAIARERLGSAADQYPVVMIARERGLYYVTFPITPPLRRGTRGGAYAYQVHIDVGSGDVVTTLVSA